MAATVHVGAGSGPNGHYYEAGDVPSSSSIGRPTLPVQERANGSGGNHSPAPGDTGSHLLLLFIILVVINLIVILGNILVIVAFYKSAKLRNVTNIFIVSLATADLLLGIFVLPYALMFEVSLLYVSLIASPVGPLGWGSGNCAPDFGRLIYAHIIIIIISYTTPMRGWLAPFGAGSPAPAESPPRAQRFRRPEASKVRRVGRRRLCF